MKIIYGLILVCLICVCLYAGKLFAISDDDNIVIDSATLESFKGGSCIIYEPNSENATSNTICANATIQCTTAQYPRDSGVWCFVLSDYKCAICTDNGQCDNDDYIAQGKGKWVCYTYTYQTWSVNCNSWLMCAS